MGKCVGLLILLILFAINIPESALISQSIPTLDEMLYRAFNGSARIYIHISCLAMFVFPVITILLTFDAMKNNTRITKERQRIYVSHIVYCFCTSHLLNFILVTFFLVHFDKMTNNPISFLTCSFAKYSVETIRKIQCLFFFSSIILTSMQFLQHFIVGECTSLNMLLSRRIRFIPTNLRVMIDLLHCYAYHTIPFVVIYIAFLVRMYFVTNSLLTVLGVLYYSIASSNISIMTCMLLYWLTHGTILAANRSSAIE